MKDLQPPRAALVIVLLLNVAGAVAAQETSEKKAPEARQAWNPALFEGAFVFAGPEAFQKYLLAADAVAIARLTQWDGEKGSVRIERSLRGKLKKEVAFVGAGGLVKAGAADKVVVLFKLDAGGMRLHSFCGAPGLYRYSDEFANLIQQLLAARAGPDPSQAAHDPITPKMRDALQRIAKIHGGMEQKTIDAAVATLQRDICELDPKVFVPLAIPHLMRLAPRDTQTRILLRRALVNGWMEAEPVWAHLVQAGDTPGPHIRALVKALDDPDLKVRRRAARALGAIGAPAAAGLPKLREMVARAKADPGDFARAYNFATEIPEHVVAHFAIQRIEAELKVRSPTGSAPSP